MIYDGDDHSSLRQSSPDTVFMDQQKDTHCDTHHDPAPGGPNKMAIFTKYQGNIQIMESAKRDKHSSRDKSHHHRSSSRPKSLALASEAKREEDEAVPDSKRQEEVADERRLKRQSDKSRQATSPELMER